VSKKKIHTYFRKAPLLFLLIAVFHIAIAGFAIWEFHDLSFGFYDWQHPLLLVAYTVCWLLVCTMKKWTVYLYLSLTCVVLIFHFILARMLHGRAISAPLFPADVLFSFITLIFFRRFER